ncbi:hypothetical protein ACPCG0_14375 [Propionibacteriaceae bacterium Y1923]|uniref:hypothetical protein n=1 Tax=Aestuariimicrobium sp. Y1814 TaxID=3418742 RepID=UPI003C1BE439
MDQPQRAHGNLELNWDDAMRAQALRDLQDVGVVAGLGGPLVSLLVIATLAMNEDNGSALVWVGGSALVVGLVLWAVLLIPYLDGRSVPNPSRQLWRGLADGTGGTGAGAAA